MRPFATALIFGSWVALALPANAAEPADITDLSLEELLALRVSSVAKRDQRLSDAAAAIFVITAEDLRRSGVTTLAEALRLAPGVDVGRINGGQWAVSARGFNSRFANKLLVLVDGRSVYTPLFSGVFWDAQDLMLEDIERIEVIRGPGAALWGANAVNGVINIITRPAQDTQGGIVSALAGNVDRGLVEARQGGQLAEGTYARAWTRLGDRDKSPPASDQGGDDEWRRARAGVRVDHASSDTRSMIEGEFYRSSVHDSTVLGTLVPPYTALFAEPFVNWGGYVLGRWQRSLASGGQASAQAYYDRAQAKYLDGSDLLTTLDVELQHRVGTIARNDITWGAGYRRQAIDFSDLAQVSIQPQKRTLELVTAFAQDEIALPDERTHVTVGARLEHNSFTGLEVQPNVRLTYAPDSSHTFWGAMSRAVRTPSLIEDSGSAALGVIPPNTPQNPGPFPVQTVVLGNSDTRAEVLVAYEAGWRAQLAPALAADIALFSNHYRDRLDPEPGVPQFSPTPVPHIVLPLPIANRGRTTVNGGEVVVDWRALPTWRLKGTYSYADYVNGPRHQSSLRSTTELPANVEFDLWLRYVSELSIADQNIPAYTTLDARLAWRATHDVELSLVGQNLLQAKHSEFRSDVLGTLPMEVPRSVYIKLRWAF